jgi:ABC-2 type transport system ATP-binding protein
MTRTACLDAVTKRFGALTALERVSFAAGAGDVLALLGPNGAGKTTALAVLLGLRWPDKGRARLFGCDPRRPGARRSVGVALQETGFPPTLRVGELLDLVRAHYPGADEAAALLRRFGLVALARRQLGGLSGGERRRVSVALAFAGRPRLVVLDEPTAGLDQEARIGVWEAVREHTAGGGTSVLTTHHLEEAEALATRIVLIDAGSIVVDGTVASIKAAAGLTRVSFRAEPGVVVDGAVRDGALLRMLTHDAGAALARLVRANVPLVDLEVRPASLEEAISALRGSG